MGVGVQFLKSTKKIMKVAVIDYGMGNIQSLSNSLEYLGAEVYVTSKHEELQNFSTFFLPGVGSFKLAVDNLKKLNLFDEIKNQLLIKKKKILGICLGMQLLGNSSTENGFSEGLKFLNNNVTKFNDEKKFSLRIPHVGFNNLSQISKNFDLFKNINELDNFYFVHSYKMRLNSNNKTFACCNYEIEFLAAFQRENIFGVQFHPEKSQSSGLVLLRNFLNL